MIGKNNSIDNYTVDNELLKKIAKCSDKIKKSFFPSPDGAFCSPSSKRSDGHSPDVGATIDGLLPKIDGLLPKSTKEESKSLKLLHEYKVMYADQMKITPTYFVLMLLFIEIFEKKELLDLNDSDYIDKCHIWHSALLTELEPKDIFEVKVNGKTLFEAAMLKNHLLLLEVIAECHPKFTVPNIQDVSPDLIINVLKNSFEAYKNNPDLTESSSELDNDNNNGSGDFILFCPALIDSASELFKNMILKEGITKKNVDLFRSFYECYLHNIKRHLCDIITLTNSPDLDYEKYCEQLLLTYINELPKLKQRRIIKKVNKNGLLVLDFVCSSSTDEDTIKESTSLESNLLQVSYTLRSSAYFSADNFVFIQNKLIETKLIKITYRVIRDLLESLSVMQNLKEILELFEQNLESSQTSVSSNDSDNSPQSTLIEASKEQLSSGSHSHRDVV